MRISDWSSDVCSSDLGLGRVFHDAPDVVHIGKPGTGPELRPGMFFTVEPMINIGKPACKVLDDGWTAVTRDRSLSAQFEHSIGITEDGCEIFTKSPKGLDTPPRSEEHTSELQSLMRISYAVFCLKKKTT